MPHNDANLKPRLVVTGASGLLGRQVCRLARSHWQVHGLYHRHRPQAHGVDLHRVDLTDKATVTDLLGTIAPRQVIHTAAVTDVMRCERQGAQTRRLNVDASGHLAGLCAERDIGFAFTSTDLVFDGRRPPYAENDPVHPISVYAEQKVEAEEAIRKTGGRWSIFRLPLMVGVGLPATASFFVHMLAAIMNDQPLHLFTDEFRTPLDTVSAARGILKLADKATGTIHLGGTTRLSRYEIGTRTAALLDKAPTMIRPVTIAGMPLAVARAPDVSLDSRKAAGLGFSPSSFDLGLKSVVEEFLSIS